MVISCSTQFSQDKGLDVTCSTQPWESQDKGLGVTCSTQPERSQDKGLVLHVAQSQGGPRTKVWCYM